jgi:hypothetical protein
MLRRLLIRLTFKLHESSASTALRLAAACPDGASVEGGVEDIMHFCLVCQCRYFNIWPSIYASLSVAVLLEPPGECL